MAEFSPTDVRRAAMDLLARREHSRYELMLKLKRRFGDHPDEFETELAKLAAEGLQSDQRLAEAFIRARTSKGQGPVKIRMELRAKCVDDETISVAFDDSGLDWSELVRSVASRKFGDVLRNTDMKSRSRISRFLQQRGFTFEHISSLF